MPKMFVGLFKRLFHLDLDLGVGQLGILRLDGQNEMGHIGQGLLYIQIFEVFCGHGSKRSYV